MKRIIYELLGLGLILFLASCSNLDSDSSLSNSGVDTECARVKPQHFVLVHGSWHSSWVWFKLADSLKQNGHKVTVVDLPGHGIDLQNPGTVTLADYQKKITDCLDQINEPVVLVGHSMGGIVISMAAEARPAKISKLVFLAAFVVKNGQSLLEVAGQDSNSLVVKYLMVNGAEGIADVDRRYIKDMFYEEADNQYVELASTLLKPDPLVPFVTPLTLTDKNFGSVRKFYIETLQDHAITPPTQESMIKTTKFERVFKIDSDHSPFFSKPKELNSILQNIAAI